MEQRRLCWYHLIRDRKAIAERLGASAEIGAELLELQQQLFAQWYQWKDGTIAGPACSRAAGRSALTSVPCASR